MSNVAELKNEENDPVNVDDNVVHGKGSRVQVVLIPDALTDGVTILGSVDIVVDGDNHGKKPSEEGQDLVGGDGGRAVRLAFGERVVCRSRR